MRKPISTLVSSCSRSIHTGKNFYRILVSQQEEEQEEEQTLQLEHGGVDGGSAVTLCPPYQHTESPDGFSGHILKTSVMEEKIFSRITMSTPSPISCQVESVEYMFRLAHTVFGALWGPAMVPLAYIP